MPPSPPMIQYICLTWTPANLVCRVALRISITPSAHRTRTNVTNTQSKSRNETLRAIKAVSSCCSLVQARRSCCQRQGSFRQINVKPSAVYFFALAFFTLRSPQRAYFNSIVAKLTSHIRGLPSLLVHKSLDYLGCDSRRQLSVFSTLEQRAHDHVGITPRREAYKPPVLGQGFIVCMFGASCQGNDLCRTRLAGDVNTRDVR